jgi:hypothetical protein
MASAKAIAGPGVGATAGPAKSAQAAPRGCGTGLALSLRQPWAALVVGGVKTIEVRGWATGWRGRLLIHAARRIDPRRDGWEQLPAGLWALSERRGGIVGVGTLAGCVTYATGEELAADRERHLADANQVSAWPVYGLVFEDVEQVPFLPVRGWRGFFPVDLGKPRSLSQGVLPFC